MNNYLKSFGANLILRFFYLFTVSILVIVFGNPIYGTTDDYILSSFIEGSYTGQSEKISIFVEPLISSLIYSFQIFIPFFNVYSIFLLLILLLSLTIFGAILNKLNSAKYLNVIWIIFSGGLTIWFALNPTYTAASMASSVINLTSLMILTSNKIKNNEKKLILIVTSILFSISYLIRPESGNAVIAIFSFFILLKIVNEIKDKNLNLKNYFLFSFIFCLLYILNIAISQNLKKEEWDVYNSWNSMRHQIQQRLPEEKLLDLRSEIGWTVPEYHLFMNLAFGDLKEFNSEWIKPAFIETQEFRGVNASVLFDRDLFLLKINQTLKSYKNYIIFNLLILFFILIFYNFNKKNYLVFFFSILIITLIVIYMSIILHTPERVIVPLLQIPLVITMYTLGIENTSLRNSFSNKYLISVVIIFTLILGKILYNQNTENKAEITQAEIKNKWLRSFSDSATFIGPVGTETYHLTSPYLKQNFNNLPTIFTTGNWETFSPHWFKRIKYLGLNSNSLYDNLFDENIYWISYPQPDNAYLVELYLKEKNYPSFFRTNKKEHASGLTIYQFSEEK